MTDYLGGFHKWNLTTRDKRERLGIDKCVYCKVTILCVSAIEDFNPCFYLFI